MRLKYDNRCQIMLHPLGCASYMIHIEIHSDTKHEISDRTNNIITINKSKCMPVRPLLRLASVIKHEAYDARCTMHNANRNARNIIKQKRIKLNEFHNSKISPILERLISVLAQSLDALQRDWVSICVLITTNNIFVINIIIIRYKKHCNRCHMMSIMKEE